LRPDPTALRRLAAVARGQRLPSALVDLDAFDRNVRYVAARAAGTGKTIRVHSKSVRCTALLRRALDLGGAAFRGVMTMTVEEAAHLAAAGLDDLLVAYPSAQPADAALLAELTRRGLQVALMVDDAAHLDLLERAGRDADVAVGACLDLDVAWRPVGSRVHLGVRRSPLRSPDDVLRLARAAAGLSHVRLVGLMGYEAHLAGPNDALPDRAVKNAVTVLAKRASFHELSARRAAVVRALAAEGVALRLVNGGGSGSLADTLRDPVVTEVSVGSAFYAPALFWHYRDVDFQPSAFFAVQVVRRPGPGWVTCQGGGYVASGDAGPHKLPVPLYPPGLALSPLEGAGEVQTPLEVLPGAVSPQVGDVVLFQHAKAGELCERFTHLHLVSGDRVVDRVPTYRGEGKAFL
jgi:D-serine deaminase-like pyridoxal phosphate-dependent protein